MISSNKQIKPKHKYLYDYIHIYLYPVVPVNPVQKLILQNKPNFCVFERKKHDFPENKANLFKAASWPLAAFSPNEAISKFLYPCIFESLYYCFYQTNPISFFDCQATGNLGKI